MKSYLVTWEIDVDANNPVEAARYAWEAMRQPNSTANSFKVIECDSTGEAVTVDLSDPEQDGKHFLPIGDDPEYCANCGSIEFRHGANGECGKKDKDDEDRRRAALAQALDESRYSQHCIADISLHHLCAGCSCQCHRTEAQP